MRGLKLLLATMLVSLSAASQYVQPFRYDHNSFTRQVNIGVGVARVTDPSAYLEIGPVSGGTKALLLPRITTTNRNAISSPAEGDFIMNTTTHRLNYFNGLIWVDPTGSFVDTAYSRNDSLLYQKNGVEYFVKRLQPYGTYLVPADTVNKYVTSVYRKTGSDSVFYTKGSSHTFAYIDSTGGSTSDTLVWKVAGNNTTTLTAEPTLGTINSDPVNFITNNITRVILPAAGIERQSGAAFKYMAYDTISKTWGYMDGDGGGGVNFVDSIFVSGDSLKYYKNGIIYFAYKVQPYGSYQSALSGTGYLKFSGTTPSYLTPTQVTADLNLFTASLKGLVPPPGASVGQYLKDDGIWDDPRDSLAIYYISKLDDSTILYHRLKGDPDTLQLNLNNGAVGGGSGTVEPGDANRLAYYPGAADLVDDLPAITANRALISDANGLPTHATTTATEIGYVNGVTSAIQTQINSKQASDQDLTDFSGLSPANDDFLQRKAGAWANRTIAQVKVDLGISGTNSGDQTSIVGITGSTAQFNTALTDNDFLTQTGSETATNKTIALGSNTISGTTAQFNTALTDNDFATLAGSETLTNKTLTTPVLNGTPTGTGVATAATVSTLALRDANGNIAADNFLQGYRTTATAAGTTTFVVGDTYLQFFTGSTTQTVVLPVTSTLVLGQQFLIVNNSTGVVTVQSSGANTIQAMVASSYIQVTCISTSGTGTSSWAWQYVPSMLSTNTASTLVLRDGSGNFSAGTITAALTGNASTATSAATLTTSRNINGVAFNGSADITVTAAAGTLTGATLAAGVTASSLTSVGTIGTGTWQGSVINSTYGGMGVNNGGRTLTLNTNSGTIAFSNASKTVTFGNTITFNGTDATTMTFPSSTTTLVGIDVSQTLTNKTFAIGSNTFSGTTAQFNTANTDGDFATIAGSETLTNKTLTAPVISSIVNTGTQTVPTVAGTLVQYATSTDASTATPAPKGDAKDNYYSLTAAATAPTFAAPSGTPTNFNSLTIRIKDNGTARALAFNAIYRASSDLALPTTTIVNKTMYLKFFYNSADSKWDFVAFLDNFSIWPVLIIPIGFRRRRRKIDELKIAA